MKRKFTVLVMGMLACCLLTGATGCGAVSSNKNTTKKPEVYALVTKSANNKFNELEVEGFTQVVEAAGGTPLICEPKEATAEEQISIIRDLIEQGVSSIAIAANDADALSSVISDARDQGIYVSTLDSDCSGSITFVNQASADDIGIALCDAVYDLCEGEGQWAILSATSQAQNQNGWIDAMQKQLENPKYANLRLVNIVYGDDNYDTSVAKTKELLSTYPNLKVICSPSTIGLSSAAEVLKEEGSSVKLTGLGLPSEMAGYVTGSNPICPKFYLWSPISLGQLSGYVSLALVEGLITGKASESFEAGDLGTFTITEQSSGATEIILDEPMEFNNKNIDLWKDQF